MRAVDALGQADKSDRQLAFERVAGPNNRAFSNIGMICQHLFHGAG